MFKNLFKIFTEHPNSVGENYYQHLWFTIKTSSILMLLAVCSIIHGIFPFLLIYKVSGTISRLNKDLINRKIK